MDELDPNRRDEHLEEAKRRLPGPTYYQVLRWIHETLRPANYVEIGIRHGWSLAQALPGTQRVGVDPEPNLKGEFPDTRVYELTSDEFFARHDLVEILGAPVALGFIDGLHLFEQVLRDFVNLEREADRDGTLVLHDSMPLDAATSTRKRTTLFYSGDVWKAAMALARRRPDLEMVTIRTAPTGLTLVRGLDPGNRNLESELAEIVSEYRELGFDHYLTNRDWMPPELPNESEAVAGWLGRTLPG